MKNSWKTNIWVLAAIIVAAGAGVDRGGVTLGTVTSSNRSTTIDVDDVHFDATHATVIADGESASLGDLERGQVVAVYGSIDENGVTGSAYTIVYDDTVDGPIESIDYSGDGQFTVLGQPVRVTADTEFAFSAAGASIDSLDTGMHVEVSGFWITPQEIQATYIGLQHPGSRLEITGVADNVTANNRKFRINDLIVKYNNAEIVGFADGHPAPGDMVEARGLTLTGSGMLQANYLEKKPAF